MALPPTYTSVEVAAHLQRTHRWLLDQARQRPDRFPSLKVGRMVVFTAAHIQTIEANLARQVPADLAAAVKQETDGWGRPVRAALRDARAKQRAS